MKFERIYFGQDAFRKLQAISAAQREALCGAPFRNQCPEDMSGIGGVASAFSTSALRGGE